MAVLVAPILGPVTVPLPVNLSVSSFCLGWSYLAKCPRMTMEEIKPHLTRAKMRSLMWGLLPHKELLINELPTADLEY